MKAIRIYVIVATMLCMSACDNKQADMYVHRYGGVKIDIFYVCSTETNEWINAQGDTMPFYRTLRQNIAAREALKN